MSCNIGQLAISPDLKTGSSGKILLSQPSLNEERWLGRLFVVAEINSRRQDNQELVDFIFKQLERQYYSDEQILLLERTSTISIEQIFEIVIADLNNQLIDFLVARKNSFSPASANITVGVLHNNQLLFANLGSNKGLLIYPAKNPDSKTVGGYNLIDVTQKVSDPTQDVFDPNKLFSNIIKGGISQNATFIIINESLYEYLSEKQLIKIISTLPPASAAVQIRNIVEQTAVFVPFLGLIIKNNRNNEESSKSSMDLKVRVHQADNPDTLHRPSKSSYETLSPLKDVNKESIRALNLTESRTAEILKPSGLIGLNLLKKIFGLFSNKNSKQRSIIKREQLIRHRAERFMVPFFKGLLMVASLLAVWIGALYRLLTNPEKRQAVVEKLQQHKQRFTWKHWLAVGIFSGGLLILVSGIWLTNYNKKLAIEKTNYQSLQTEIDKHFSDLSAIKIYGDQASADEHLTAIKNILAKLPTKTTDQQKYIEMVNTRYNQAFEETYRFTKTSNPLWKATTDWRSLGVYKNDLIAIAGRTLWRQNNNDFEEIINDLGVDDCKPLKVSEYNENFYCLANSEVLAINLANKQILHLPLDQAPINPKGAAIYNGRLYVAADDGQIYRFTGQTTGWVAKQSWLSSPLNNKPQDLIIDSSIFLLTSNGLSQYLSGEAQNFSPQIYPTMNEAKYLAGNKSSANLYIYSGDYNGRIIVIDKKGKLINQYIGENWQNIKDIDLSDDGKMLYILKADGVERIEL